MASTQPLSVLVVDPDLQSRGAIASFLSGEGYRATELGELDAAPNEIKKGRYQMVLLDIGAANGHGMELLREIRSQDDDLCVICLTEAPDVETAVATMKHRAFDYLEKPCPTEQLRSVMRAAIKEHGLLVDVEEQLNQAVGERIRTRRHELGLTLKQVANRTGLSVSLISQIELGKSAASVLTLYKVATALGTRVASFFEAV